MARSDNADMACARRLLALARDLLQAADLRAVVELIGGTLVELLTPDESLMLARLAEQEYATAFGPLGELQPPHRDGQLFLRAQAALTGQTPVVAPTLAAVPLQAGDAPEALAGQDEGSFMAFPFPPFEALGVLATRWSTPPAEDERARRLGILRQLGELTGAALGNVDFRLMLEAQVSACAEQVEAAARAHAAELRERDHLVEQIRRISDTDVLTGMLNRRGFFRQAESAHKLARRQGLTSALMFADIDGLKAVNDGLGHDAGDRLIQDSAWILRNSFRDSDILSRFGGDEFAAYSPDAAQPENILRRIQDNIERFHRQSPRPYRVSFSTGVVLCDPLSDLALADYLGEADKRMYAHKKEGRRRP